MAQLARGLRLLLLAWAPTAAALVAVTAPRAAPDATFYARQTPQQPAPGADAPAAGVPAAQETQPCPLVQLAQDMAMDPGYVRWHGQRGSWKTSSGIALGSWQQNYWTQSYADVLISDLNRQLAAQAVPTDDEQLLSEFNWRVTANLSSFPPLAQLEAQYDAAASAGGREAELAAAGIAPPANATNATYKVVDCGGNLRYVVKLEAEGLRPGGVDVYDEGGRLLAHSFAGHDSAGLVFVDPSGYSLATAEAPVLGAGLSPRQLPRDTATGGVLPYQIRFELGNYPNASRLLDVHYRWVLASALQLKAIHDAQGPGIEQPAILAVISVAYWSLAALGLAFGVYLLCLFYRAVLLPAAGYPADAGAYAKRTW